MAVHEAVEVVQDVGGCGPHVHKAHSHNRLGNQSTSVISGNQLDGRKGGPCPVPFGVLMLEKLE